MFTIYSSAIEHYELFNRTYFCTLNIGISFLWYVPLYIILFSTLEIPVVFVDLQYVCAYKYNCFYYCDIEQIFKYQYIILTSLFRFETIVLFSHINEPAQIYHDIKIQQIFQINSRYYIKYTTLCRKISIDTLAT